MGRDGWKPRPHAVLVQPVAPSHGLLATLADAYPGLRIVVVPEVIGTHERVVPSTTPGAAATA